MDVVVSEVSMVREINEREIKIYTDGGRICRPLLIVDTDKQKLLIKKGHIDQLKQSQEMISAEGKYSWQELLAAGAIELIDCLEEETTMIGMFQLQKFHH